MKPQESIGSSLVEKSWPLFGMFMVADGVMVMVVVMVAEGVVMVVRVMVAERAAKLISLLMTSFEW